MRSISSYFCSKSNKDDVKPSCTQEADTQPHALLRVSGMFEDLQGVAHANPNPNPNPNPKC